MHPSRGILREQIATWLDVAPNCVLYSYIYTGALYLLGRKFEEYNRIAGSFPFVRNSMIRLHRWQNDVPDKLVEKMLETYTKGGDTAIENTLIEIVHRGRCDRGEKKVWGFHRGESTRGVQEIR